MKLKISIVEGAFIRIQKAITLNDIKNLDYSHAAMLIRYEI